MLYIWQSSVHNRETIFIDYPEARTKSATPVQYTLWKQYDTKHGYLMIVLEPNTQITN